MNERKRSSRGMGRFWVAAAAVGGAVVAFLADPARGRARRQAAMERLRTGVDAVADRTQQWQRAIVARTSRGTPKMTSLTSGPSDGGSSGDGPQASATSQPTRSTSEPNRPES